MAELISPLSRLVVATQQDADGAVCGAFEGVAAVAGEAGEQVGGVEEGAPGFVLVDVGEFVGEGGVVQTGVGDDDVAEGDGFEAAPSEEAGKATGAPLRSGLEQEDAAVEDWAGAGGGCPEEADEGVRGSPKVAPPGAAVGEEGAEAVCPQPGVGYPAVAGGTGRSHRWTSWPSRSTEVSKP